MEVNLSPCCEEHRYDKANTRHLERAQAITAMRTALEQQEEK